MTIVIVLLLAVLTFAYIVYPFFKQTSSSTDNKSQDFSTRKMTDYSVDKDAKAIKEKLETEDEIEKQILNLRRSKKSTQTENQTKTP